MKRFLLIPVAAVLLLVPGCKQSGKESAPADVRTFWDGKTLLEEDYRTSEDRFADFAEAAVNAPLEEAIAALDGLFDRLKEENDEVTYYIYAEWMAAAFYDIFSPCRNAALYDHAVDRMEADGILPPYDCEPYRQKSDWMKVNCPGEKATLPEPDPEGRNTLVLVMNLSCPTCHDALNRLAGLTEWADARHLALCCGFGPIPEVTGWEYRRVENAGAYFDIHMTPCYYIIDPDGVVLHPYAPAL